MTLREFQASEYADESHFLLLGNPVSHSLSPLMHNTAAKHYHMPVRYYAVELQQDELELIGTTLKNEKLKGVNITIPYKHFLFAHLNEIDSVCNQIGAVNALVKKQQGWKGFNTDHYGFMVPLKPYLNQIKDRGTIVFGAGGAAKAVLYALNEAGVKNLTLVSRNPDTVEDKMAERASHIVSYERWPAFSDHVKLIVNTTPLGMKPYLGKSPVKTDEKRYLNDKICYDLIYNPLETEFLKLADKTGKVTINGLEMLIHQGSKLFELWTGKSFPIELIRTELHKAIEA